MSVLTDPPKLKVLVKQDTVYHVYVNGKLVLENETFAVADQLRDALTGYPEAACGEIREVARNIIQQFRPEADAALEQRAEEILS